MKEIKNNMSLEQFEKKLDSIIDASGAEEISIEELNNIVSTSVEMDKVNDDADETGVVSILLKDAKVTFDLLQTYDDEEYKHIHVLLESKEVIDLE